MKVLVIGPDETPPEPKAMPVKSGGQKKVRMRATAYPGIRMYYTFIWYSYWIGRVRGFGEDTMKILYSGCHAILAYEKSILENEEIKECYFSVALTEKGVQHIMNLHNGWKEIINQLNQFAYCPIEEVDAIDSIPFSLDENGCFIKK